MWSNKIAELIDANVVRIRRSHFTFKGVTENDQGPIELTFDGNKVLLLDTKSDWSIRIDDQPWFDPFSGELSAENAEFVLSHGKWVARDVSDESSYLNIIGHPLLDASPRYNEVGELCAVYLEFPHARIAARSESGELTVEVYERSS
jgi:hypothetical protein